MINCEFSNPVYWDRAALDLLPLDDEISELDNWNYQNMVCEEGSVEEIESGENSFFLSKNITYGDFLIVSFLLLIFTIFVTFKIRDFVKNRKLERL